MARPIPNPFRFGALARDESFTDRDVEIAELLSDARNGQDVVIFAPRRFGKTSLVDRVAQRLVGDRVLVGQINLMRTPTKERLAEKLAATVYEDIAGPLTRAKDFGARIFRGLRITPTMTLDPETGALSFGFGAGHLPEDVDATLERLFELVAQVAAERERGALLILDEFQEVIELDPQLPEAAAVRPAGAARGRALLPRQQAPHDGADLQRRERAVLAERQAARARPDPAGAVRRLHRAALRRHRPPDRPDRRRADPHDHGRPPVRHPGALLLPLGGDADPPRRDRGAPRRRLERVLRSEHTHFSLLWDRASANQKLVLQALAREPGHPFAEDYRRRHALRAVSSTQKAVEALARDELVGRDRGRAWIAEPFLAEWIRANVQ